MFDYIYNYSYILLHIDNDCHFYYINFMNTECNPK